MKSEDPGLRIARCYFMRAGSQLHVLPIVKSSQLKQQITTQTEYDIVGNFRRRKLLPIGEKYDICRENFRRSLAFTTPKDATPTNFAEKTFADCSLLLRQRMLCPQISRRKLLQIATKLQNSGQFSPSKVSRYTVPYNLFITSTLYSLSPSGDPFPKIEYTKEEIETW